MLTAFSPEAHTLLMVVASTLVGRPAKMAACLAGACPTPADSTLPMYTASIEETGTFDFSRADLIAVAPSCVAETVVKLPLNCSLVSRLPQQCDQIARTTAVGVRLALMMYASLTSFFCCAEALNCLWRLAKRCCGRDVILMDVRRADDDMVTAKRKCTVQWE